MNRANGGGPHDSCAGDLPSQGSRVQEKGVIFNKLNRGVTFQQGAERQIGRHREEDTVSSRGEDSPAVGGQ